jgi:hypothetical protein
VRARLILVASFLALAACGSGSSPTEDAASMGSSAMCVESYDTKSLAKREYAFDGTVTEVEPGSSGENPEPDRVTFKVNSWFKGGEGTDAMRHSHGFQGTTSAGGEPRSVGDRLLVSGDAGFVWECGFTRPHTAEAASEWEQVFKGD